MQSPKFSLVDFLYKDVGIKIKLTFKESKGSIGSEKYEKHINGIILEILFCFKNQIVLELNKFVCYSQYANSQ